MKQSFSILWMIVGALWSGVVPTGAQVNVTQHHNHDSRDGLYIDSAFTPAGAANLRAPPNSAAGIKSGGSTIVNHVPFNGFRFQKRLDQIWPNIYKRRFPAS